MSSTPNRRSHEDGGNGSGSGTHSHPSGLKYPHDDQGAYSGTGGKAVMPTRHDYHAPYDMGQDGRIPKIVPRNESHDSDRKPPLLPNMFRVSNSNDTQFDHVGSETRTKVDTRDIKPDSRDLKQSTKIASSGGVDDGKDAKLERDFSSDHKGEIKLDKTVYTGSNSSLSWKEQQYRVKQNPDGPGGNVDTWHTSRTSLQGPTEAVKEGLHLEERDLADAREGPRENKFDMNVDDKFKDKDRKRKEMKHKDWGERDKDRHDRRNLQVGGTGGENKEVLREERESEKKDPLRDKEKLTEKIPLKRESWNESKKDASHSEKELVDNHGKSVEQDFPASELKKKDSDTWKNVEGEGRDKKRERDTEVESEKSDKHSRYHEKETDECGMESEGCSEVQQRKRMLRSRGSPPMGNRDLRIRPHSNDTEGPQGDASCVVYKIGECMQELIKLWKEYELSQANKALQSSRDGPTLEIRIPAEHVTATNRQVRGGQLWGTDIYTVDSDLVGVLMHTGYCRPTASPPPPATQELCATIRVLPPQDCYISTLRNNVRSRAWGAAIGCSYRVERCCIVKKGGGIIDLEPCLTHSSTMEPTLAPVSVERTMTTRAAASNALRQQRFVREVTIQFNLCMEPWLKYSISAVADKGLKKPFFTSARMKKGEVLYVETHSCRYELCFNGEKVPKAAAVPPHASGAENGRSQAYTNSNGERNGMDGDSNLVDIYRWSRCKKPLTEKTMRNIGIPLPRENIQVLEEELEWENISWSQTGVWIAGKEYHLARVHFLSRN